MNKSILKSYAPQARRDFIQAVTDRAGMLGLSLQGNLPVDISGDLAMINGRPFPKSVAESRRALDNWIRAKGFEQVMEEVAYRWFNRCAALRYMELHDYLGHGLRVLSNPTGSTIPEILDRAADVDLPELDRDEVIRLRLAGDRDADLYRLLLLAQCRALGRVMPVIFGADDDARHEATDLLLPDNLLQTGSPVRRLVETVPEEDWREIEIVGWLYQFYISEKKDQVIGKVVKSEDIPAATQLFTPNWIVKYMVQNTLGRKWLMTYPQSPLRAKMEFSIEPAQQEPEVQAQLDAITPRELHPEELTFCDPASGSGHILAEAYDLFKEIYLERGYRTRDIPRLILEKNLYGMDIDDRAAQLARFTVLMKARADDHRILDPDNPVHLNILAFQQTNGLNVETLAPVLLRTRVQTFAPTGPKQLPLIQPKAVKQPLKTSTPPDVTRDELSGLLHIFQDVKTFGSLLTIPPTLQQALPRFHQLLDKAKTMDVEAQRYTDRLRPLVHQAELLAMQYDFVVANPPYMGGMPSSLKSFAKYKYPDSKSDLFAMFIERNLAMTKTDGLASLITMQSWMFLSSFEKMREKILRKNTFFSMSHLGARAFDSISGEVVQTTAFVLLKEKLKKYTGTYLRLVGGKSESQKIDLFKCSSNLYTSSSSDFMKIPGSPIAYWVSNTILKCFEFGLNLIDFAKPRQGLATSDNNRFVRTWCEVSYLNIAFECADRDEAIETGQRWFPFNKGGTFRRWGGNSELVVNWENDGEEIKDSILTKYPYLNGNPDFVAKNPNYYFKSGLTWSALSSGLFSIRFQEKGFIFADKGQALFPYATEHLLPLEGLLNSKVVVEFLKALSPTLDFNSGYIAKIPCIIKKSPGVRKLNKIFWSDWDSYETSWNFNNSEFLSKIYRKPYLSVTYYELRAEWRNTTLEVQRLEEENNRIFIEAYGLQDELTPDVPLHEITLTCNPHYRYGPGKTDEEYEALQRADTMRELISYSIGCMMGRYSLDEPGLIYAHSGGEGFDPSRYATFPADDDGIVPVMDEAWFEDDAATRFAEFLRVAWSPETLDENLKFVADSLDPKTGEPPAQTIRRYLSTRFFKDHLKTYKKRPIYWLFSSGKHRAFECLVYLHRYSANTLARMRSEYVTPLQGKINARIEFLAKEADAPGGSAAAKRQHGKELETMRKKQQELRTFDDLLRHYADKRITLDLDDGVKVNYGKFGTLLAEVKAVTGGRVEG